MIILDLIAPERTVRPATESRPGNTDRNARTPTTDELAAFRAQCPTWLAPTPYIHRVDGQHTGTTDEILQWAAAKWGFDPDTVRAQAWIESSHDMDTVGDNGESFGLLQVKSTLVTGSAPLTQLSTAFSVDLGLMILRVYFDGLMDWMFDKTGGQAYAPGDLWGSLGAYFSGEWHTAGSIGYQQKVRRALRDRAWT